MAGWLRMADAPIGVFDHEIYAMAATDRLYMRQRAGIEPRRTYEWDRLTNTWAELPLLPQDTSPVCMAVIGTKLYALSGGFTHPTNGAFKTVQNLYEWEHGATEWAGPLATPPNGGVVAVVGAVAGLLYAFGPTSSGNGTGPVLGDLFSWDPVSNTWTGRGPFSYVGRPTPTFVGRNGWSSAGGKLFRYMAYQQGSPATLYRELFQFDPVTNAWTVKAAVPADFYTDPVRPHGSQGGNYYLLSNGPVLLFPGLTTSQFFTTFEYCWGYDIATDTWTNRKERYPWFFPLNNVAMAAMNNRVYFQGGLFETEFTLHEWAERHGLGKLRPPSGVYSPTDVTS